MLIPRRSAPLLALAVFCCLILLLQPAAQRRSWRQIPEVVGLGEVVPDEYTARETHPPSFSPNQVSNVISAGSGARITQSPSSVPNQAAQVVSGESTALGRLPSYSLPGQASQVQSEIGSSRTRLASSLPNKPTQLGNKPIWKPRPIFPPGVPLGPGHNYTKVLVMPKVREENTEWVHEKLPGLQTAIYVADDPSALLHPPKNKGNEVMIYLTYLIDHYEDLPDIMMFLHSHRFSWHNNDILNKDAYEIISRLSSERVVREGYMNLRCHWNPGCPEWIHPGRIEADDWKKEEREVAKVWSELFPLETIPEVVAQPCCGQFALSRERVLAIPKSDFVHYRDWLLRTDLPDSLSGRVWEYLWQYLFTGHNTLCPDQHVCYCDGYGVCFEDDDAFDHWFELKWKQNDLRKELDIWQEKAKLLVDAAAGVLDEGNQLEVAEVGKDAVLQQEIDQLQQQMDEQRDNAVHRGNDARNRAMIAGREWHDGDWY
jgi:Protein of unknown function (DUF3431)